MTKSEAASIVNNPLATDKQKATAQSFIDSYTPVADPANQMLIGLLKRHLTRECCDPIKFPVYRAEIQKQLTLRKSL